MLALREAIAAKVERLYGHAYDPGTEITVTAGATQAIFTAILALAHPGDEVIVFEPAYDSYMPAIQLAGATPVPLPLTVPGLSRSTSTRCAARSRRARAMILVNTPNNPGTSVLSAADLRRAGGRCCATRRSCVVSDEVYEHMVYDGARAREPRARTPSSRRAASSIGSFGKTYHATGWKVGYALAPPAITAEIRQVHQFTVFTVNSAVQHGARGIPARSVALPRRCRRSSPPSATCFARRWRLRRSTLLPCARQLFPARRRTRASATSPRPNSRSGWCARSASRRYRCRRSTRTAPITG